MASLLAHPLVATLALSGTLCVATACDSDPTSPEQDPGTIVEVATEAGSFNTLLTALGAAGLDEVLAGEGPFTVFAPTDEAFAQIPAETLQALLADTEALTGVLLYHVVAGEVRAADVVQLSSATTVNGADVSIVVEGGSVKVNGANVVATDIEASNGVIHVIDAVLIP